LLREKEAELLREWIREQTQTLSTQQGRLSETDLREQSREFLALLRRATQDGELADVRGSGWREVLDALASLSRSRARQGFTPAQTASFIFSLKGPLFALLRKELGNDGAALADETWTASVLLDQLGLYTAESFIKNREEIISRQQEEMLELSTPVVKLWEGVLALPMIGTLDSARTQIVMETLLQKIVETGAEVAIIDITGVPTVDTLVAQHLIKTVTAARLMGADCIISGIRPQIARPRS
jgi:rsbT co-antagonist protein RsbR